MLNLPRFKSALILIATPLAIYLGLLNLVDRSQRVTPFDGIVWSQSEKGLVVSRVLDSELAALLPAGAVLKDINGVAVRTLDHHAEMVEVLTESSSGVDVTDYTFVLPADGSEITLPVRLELQAQLGARDIPLILVAAAFLIIGALTYLRNSASPGAFHFALLCLVAFCLLLFRHSGRADGFDLAVYWLSAGPFLLLPPLFLHFCLQFPEPGYLVRTRPRFVHLVYLPALLLLGVHLAWFAGVLQPAGAPRNPEWGHFLDRLELFHFLAVFGAAAWVLSRARHQASRVVERKQVQWIVAGTVLGLLPFGALYGVPYLLGFPTTSWMEASVLSLALIPLSFGYAIAKFRLRDVELIFKRGAAYVIASSALLAFYVGIALLIANALQGLSTESGTLLLAVSALAVAVFFAPLRDRIQEQLDRYFYKDRYGDRRSLLDFGRTLASEIQLPDLSDKICDRVRRTLDVSPVAIFLREDLAPQRFRLETAVAMESGNPESVELPDNALHFLEAQTGTLDLDLVPSSVSVLQTTLRRWAIRYCAPLSVRGRLIGFLCFGRKRNGDFLDSEELEMVSSLADYAAIAVDNAALYRSLEAKAAELHQLRVYSDNVIESISLGVVVVTAEGRITVWNGAMTAISGIPRDRAVGRPLAEVLPADLTAALRDMLDGPDWIVRELTQLFKAHLDGAGQSRLINVTLSPFISRDNINTGTLLVVDDITDKVRLESQLQQAEKLSSIGLFAAGLAHEVNTPLAGISSYAQMLLEETPADDPRRDLLKKIERQSFRASEIVNNLLNFARFSDRDFEEVNINALMLDTLSLLEHQFRKHGIQVEMNFDPTLPKTVGNGGKLQQVFMNLFLNARDSMPEGGKLRLATRLENSELVVEVEDTGVGISKEDIKRIYDPFFTTKPVGKGTGLGLSVSYGIIQEHSGRIAVTSEPGRGTSFSLYLPVKRIN
ncbi:MAG: hypothetical protein Kow001_15650 [Acidobacteriota bacterium]